MGWRDHLGIHPACELLPPLPQDELHALGEDIRKNRLQERAKVMRRGNKFVLLDGRSRLDAIETVGMPIRVFEGDTPNRHFFEVVEVDDPIAFVISANIRRRHLSGEDKGRLIAELIKLDPMKSNRQIAKATDTSHPTVGKVRTKLEQAGDVVTITTSVDTKGRKQPARKSKPGIPPPDAERSAVERRQRYDADEARVPAQAAPWNGIAVIAAIEAIETLCDAIRHATPEEVVAESDSAALIRLARDAELGSAWLGELQALAKSAAKRAGDCQDGEVS